MNLITLESVGSFYNKQTRIVYPIQKDNKPDLKMGIHILLCSDEFMDRLSKTDYNKIHYGNN